MSPVKGKSSSRRKGKKVATDDPTIKAMGEESPYSKSNHSKEGEGVTIWVVSVLLLSTRGTTPISTS